MSKYVSPLSFYLAAKDYVERSGFGDEVRWQASLDFHQFTESDLLRQSAWVILCSGFKEEVVRSRFAFISFCFCDWESSSLICERANLCKATALSCFRNVRKIEAIVDSAAHISDIGFQTYKEQILAEPIQALQALPFIGKITAYHLAKNLGAAVAKPDRHLERLSTAMGFENPLQLCSCLSKESNDPISVVDLVLWRYAERMGSTARLTPHDA